MFFYKNSIAADFKCSYLNERLAWRGFEYTDRNRRCWITRYRIGFGLLWAFSIETHPCSFLMFLQFQILINSYEFLSVLIRSYEFLSVYIRPYPSLSVYIRSYPSLSILIRPHPFLWILIRPYAFLSVLMNSYPSLSVLIRSSLCLYVLHTIFPPKNPHLTSLTKPCHVLLYPPGSAMICI